MTVDKIIQTAKEQGTQSAVLLEQLAQIVKEGGGGANIMVVNFTWPDTEADPVADKTVREIYDALKAGMRVIGVISEDYGELGADIVFEFTCGETDNYIEDDVPINYVTAGGYIVSDYLPYFNSMIQGYTISSGDEEVDIWFIDYIGTDLTDYLRLSSFHNSLALFPSGTHRTDFLFASIYIEDLRGKYLTDTVTNTSGETHTVREIYDALRSYYLSSSWGPVVITLLNSGKAEYGHARVFRLDTTYDSSSRTVNTFYAYSYITGTMAKLVFTIDDSVPVSVHVITVKDIFNLIESANAGE